MVLRVYLKLGIFSLLCHLNLYGLSVALSSQEAWEIGKKIWHNESAGKVEGLTWWNANEEFASLGIGHFIWYSVGQKKLFQETFPSFLYFVKSNKRPLPSFLQKSTERHCPWRNREEFLQALQSSQMQELRKFLLDTIDLQVAFMIRRLEQALPRILETTPPTKRSHIKKQFYRLLKMPQGMYALIDYINFKGEGTAPHEHYQGNRWGLLQVLECMKEIKSEHEAMKEFVLAATYVLERRINHAPPERNEIRWLPGWKNRLATYIK